VHEQRPSQPDNHPLTRFKYTPTPEVPQDAHPTHTHRQRLTLDLKPAGENLIMRQPVFIGDDVHEPDPQKPPVRLAGVIHSKLKAKAE